MATTTSAAAGEEEGGAAVTHTFVNALVELSEKLDKWEKDDSMTKTETVNEVRTHILRCVRAGLVHPFTSFYSLEASTVLDRTAPPL